MNPSFSLFFCVSLLTLLIDNLNAKPTWALRDSATVGNHYSDFISAMFTYRNETRISTEPELIKYVVQSYFNGIRNGNYPGYAKFKSETEKAIIVAILALSEDEIASKAADILGQGVKTIAGEYLNKYLYAKAYTIQNRGLFPGNDVPDTAIETAFNQIC